MKHSSILRAAKAVLANEADAINEVRRNLNEDFINACLCIESTTGRLITMGMGKSGHIATKVAATFASTGTPSFFVHPGEASHGDLGMILSDDVVLVFSNSGKTEEVCKLLGALKTLGPKVIAITQSKESTIGAAADICLEAEILEEACPLGLAPTTSTTVALALGDALGGVRPWPKNFSKDDFARAHPSATWAAGY